MRKVPIPLLVGMFVAGAIVSMYGYQSHFGPSGLLYYDEARSYGGYNLITPLRPGPAPDFGYHATYLMDMRGNVINSWPLPQYGYTIEKQTQFLDNGNLLRRIGTSTWQHGWDDSWPGTDPAASPTDAARLQELDWDGNIVYEIADTRPRLQAPSHVREDFQQEAPGVHYPEHRQQGHHARTGACGRRRSRACGTITRRFPTASSSSNSTAT